MPILVDNFSMDVSDWKAISDIEYFSVDIVDYDYPISTSGTYFIHDGIVVDTTFSGIPYGYTAYYTSSGISTSGILLTIHAENTNYEILDQAYEFLYGYRVDFDEYIDWGPMYTVVTTAKASNMVFCPNTVAASSYFETRDLDSFNLGATIRPVEDVNLGAQIFPQNPFFFYGRTFMLTVSGVKDFSGNVLDPVVISFTIENPNI